MLSDPKADRGRDLGPHLSGGRPPLGRQPWRTDERWGSYRSATTRGVAAAALRTKAGRDRSGEGAGWPSTGPSVSLRPGVTSIGAVVADGGVAAGCAVVELVLLAESHAARANTANSTAHRVRRFVTRSRDGMTPRMRIADEAMVCGVLTSSLVETEDLHTREEPCWCVGCLAIDFR